MKIQLDHNRMADSLFAFNALQRAMNPKTQLIGRGELAAIICLQKDAFLQLVTGLHPYASEIDAEEASFEFEGEAVVRQILETEIPKIVLAKLQHASYPLQETITTLRCYMHHKPLPRITPCW